MNGAAIRYLSPVGGHLCALGFAFTQAGRSFGITAGGLYSLKETWDAARDARKNERSYAGLLIRRGCHLHLIRVANYSRYGLIAGAESSVRPVIPFLPGSSIMSLTVVQTFRFCHKCQTLFHEGRSEPAGTAKGRCPAGGAHEAMGYIFEIPVHGVESPTAQTRWRFCEPCWAMFFDGSPSKGRCPGSRNGHRRESRFGHNFGLPHDVPGTPTAQTQWRFCNKCFAMFYDGYPQKGRCSAGGAHFAQGYGFVLPHRRP